MKKSEKKNLVRIGLIQMRSDHSSALNFAKALKYVQKAAQKGAQIVCLEELFKTDYFPQTRNRNHFRLGEPIPGPTTEIFSALARKFNVVLIVPVFEKRSEKLYHNTAVVIDADGSILGLYRKMHIPNDPCYYERFYFAPGGFPLTPTLSPKGRGEAAAGEPRQGRGEGSVYKTRYGKISVLICWDQWFPEAARMAALSGAKILFYPTAIGYLRGEKKKSHREEKDAWETIQRSHAIANGMYVAVVNRVGREGKLTFWGNSFVAGPMGEMITRADELHERILIADCDLSKIKSVRSTWPFLRERRIDAYRGLTKGI